MPWVSASLSPIRLPRSQPAPIKLGIAYTPEPKDAELRSISFELSRHITIRTQGLPGCPISDLYSTAVSAARICAGSLVGHGSVTSEIAVPGQAAAPLKRELLAFYDKSGGRRYILAQVTSGPPNPLTYVIPFVIEETSGIYGLDLTVADMSHVYGVVPFGPQPYYLEGVYSKISEFILILRRVYRQKGKRESLLSANCPAPPGVRTFGFRFMKANITAAISGGPPRSLSEVEPRICEALG